MSLLSPPHSFRFVADPSALLARNLSAARRARSLTQQALARRSRVSRATIAQLESGRGDARLSTISLLAASLDVPVVALLLDTGNLAALSDRASSVQASTEQATPDRASSPFEASAPRDDASRAMAAAIVSASTLGPAAQPPAIVGLTRLIGTEPASGDRR